MGLLPLDIERVEHIEPQSEEHSPHEPAIASVAEVERRDRINRRALGAADGLAFVAAAALVAWLSGKSLNWGLLGVAPFAVLVAKISQLYGRDEVVISKTIIAEWRHVLQTAALSSIGIYLAWRLVTHDHAGGGMRVYLLLVAIAFGFSLLGRDAARRIARALVPAERCVIIGDPRRVSALAHRLMKAPGVEFVGAISEGALSGSVVELRAAVEQLHVHRVIITPSWEADDAITLHLIQAAKFIGVRVSLLPSVMTAVGGVAAFDDLDGLILLGVPSFGLSRSSANLKRAFDIVAGVILLGVFGPLMLLLSALIRLDSRGPALFRQTRIGRGGKPFEILKFRSMVDGADSMKEELLKLNEASDGLFKIAEDPRITKLGGYLRRAHLDELPQLINVIRGEMSLVGPRPLVVEEDARVKGRDRHRIHLTPGITGPWQVRGPMNTPLSEMAKLDYMYASTWSIWQDVDILLKTFSRVLNRSGH